MAEFRTGENTWIAQLGNLRNTIRQELIARQLEEALSAGPVPGEGTVLDVGCGQGTQALRLLQRGYTVTGVDPSAELRGLFEADAVAIARDVELHEGQIDDLGDVLGQRTFSVVCCHGVLMYLPDRAEAIAQLASHVSADGLFSFTVRNGHALAYRPGLRRDWAGAVAAFGSREYVNGIGVTAVADLLEDVEAHLDAVGFRIDRWFGVRMFNEGVPAEMQLPDSEDGDALLEAEYLAGSTDPYRWLGSQLHIIARRA